MTLKIATLDGEVAAQRMTHPVGRILKRQVESTCVVLQF